MRRLKRSFLLLALVGAAIAQTESQIESESVKRVGKHIACQCGACTENIDCNMSSGQCHFCKPARTKIFQMQQAGMNDDSIVDWFKKQYGAGIFRADPNSFFWMIPYLALIAGGAVVWVVLKKMRVRHAPLAVEDPAYARYRAAIEKDTEKLDRTKWTAV
jgi:cytochrome c-type biogenesis protein CcmH/NrfF